MGRMSPLHSPTELGQGSSIPPISTAANTLNGTTVDLHGRRGAHFVLQLGALTGDATVAAHLQTNDLPLDPGNGNWTNVNSTTYPNAAVTAKGNGCADHVNTAWDMSYDPAVGGSPIVRAVRVTSENTAVTSISHLVF
jgi:hypothetical protein